MRIGLLQGRDESGEPEEFAWDLFPLVDSSKARHLDATGLPRPGTRIEPGLIVVGKNDQSRRSDEGRSPTPRRSPIMA